MRRRRFQTIYFFIWHVILIGAGFALGFIFLSPWGPPRCSACGADFVAYVLALVVVGFMTIAEWDTLWGQWGVWDPFLKLMLPSSVLFVYVAVHIALGNPSLCGSLCFDTVGPVFDLLFYSHGLVAVAFLMYYFALRDLAGLRRSRLLTLLMLVFSGVGIVLDILDD